MSTATFDRPSMPAASASKAGTAVLITGGVVAAALAGLLVGRALPHTATVVAPASRFAIEKSGSDAFAHQYGSHGIEMSGAAAQLSAPGSAYLPSGSMFHEQVPRAAAIVTLAAPLAAAGSSYAVTGSTYSEQVPWLARQSSLRDHFYADYGDGSSYAPGGSTYQSQVPDLASAAGLRQMHLRAAW